jgi:hypothetical protein
MLITSMEREGHDTTHALTLLDGLNEILLSFEYRRSIIVSVLDQSSV